MLDSESQMVEAKNLTGGLTEIDEMNCCAIDMART